MYFTHQVQNKYTTELRCKPEYHRFLIGRGGSNIRQVEYTIIQYMYIVYCQVTHKSHHLSMFLVYDHSEWFLYDVYVCSYSVMKKIPVFLVY